MCAVGMEYALSGFTSEFMTEFQAVIKRVFAFILNPPAKSYAGKRHLDQCFEYEKHFQTSGKLISVLMFIDVVF